MKSVWIAFMLVLVLVVPSAMAQERIENDNPHRLLQEVAETMLQRIRDDRERIEQEPNYLRVIMEEELIPYTDYRFAAAQVMGRNWRALDDEQRRQFVDAFRSYLINTYARVFTQYDEEKHELQFGREDDYENERVVIVRAQLNQEDGPPIRLNFNLRRQTPESPWMAFDLEAENISLLSAQRSEIQSILSQRGFDGAIELLRERASVEIDLDEELDADEFTSQG
ncbi:organic solvent ABC transporter [Aliidiomarina sedimenti]|uniref:Organic solvent ABC transporter n=1 Tax=Aliidiomarina sedimenti TaxID=1933879 RepID=A0ABY0BY47_9GAMM|nr:ABC transporter substrate-binding protein [Aliidiomarina sedimenti]RUO29356.1 organic solvent ABC transporter [Aliidiomarina sedimenti]